MSTREERVLYEPKKMYAKMKIDGLGGAPTGGHCTSTIVTDVNRTTSDLFKHYIGPALVENLQRESCLWDRFKGGNMIEFRTSRWYLWGRIKKIVGYLKQVYRAIKYLEVENGERENEIQKVQDRVELLERHFDLKYHGPDITGSYYAPVKKAKKARKRVKK
jgi:hypothetical protein